jgi:1-acyl-sn-glycerol-3-phosphate acyltransferase
MSPKTAKFILSLFGWKIIGKKPAELKKYIVIMAPHTSNWDFVIGWFGYRTLGLKAKFLIKKEAFFFPLGSLIKSMGAIPINRHSSASAIKQISHLFKHSKELIITITPEGTRSLNKHWKKGFYYMAHLSNVPLILGFLDYKNKTGGLGPILNVTGNFDQDMKIIEEFYKDKTAKFPKNFNFSPQNRTRK